MLKEHSVWVEKYRPDSLEGYLMESEDIKSKMDEFIEKQDIQNLLFAGPPGSGKTTLAKILVKNIDCDYLYLNAVDKRSMEDIKNDIIPFASVMSFKSSPKIVILDEATHILQASQVLLLSIIETYSLNTRFILTGNYPERLIPALRSRLQEFDLKPPTKKVVARHLYKILKVEEIEFENTELVPIINEYYPDLRRIINNAQKYVIDGKIVLPTKVSGNDDVEDKIILELQNKNKKSFTTIRQLIADGDISDFESLYKKLYDESNKFADGREGMVTIIVSDSMFQSTTLIDKEICFCSCIARILEIL